MGPHGGEPPGALLSADRIRAETFGARTRQVQTCERRGSGGLATGMRFWRKLCFCFRRRRFEEELAEEMRLHRHLRARRLVSDGLKPELADREASRQFGNELHHREASGDVWIIRWLQNGLQDLRFTARTMSKRLGFAMVAMI